MTRATRFSAADAFKANRGQEAPDHAQRELHVVGQHTSSFPLPRARHVPDLDAPVDFGFRAVTFKELALTRSP